MEGLSIIIPFHSEKIDPQSFIAWMNQTMWGINRLRRFGVHYEIIVVTGKPTQKNQLVLEHVHNFSQYLPIKIFSQQTHTKRRLCIKGFAQASYDVIVKLEPGVFSSPTELVNMLAKLEDNTDVIVLYQTEKPLEHPEEFTTVTDPFTDTIPLDTHEEATMMRKRVWDIIEFTPLAEHTFALECIQHACEGGFAVKTYSHYVEQHTTSTVLEHFKQATILKLQVMLLKMKKIDPQYIPPTNDHNMINAGFGYKKMKYITHTTLTYKKSAITSFDWKQIVAYLLFFEYLIIGLIVMPLFVLQSCIAVLSIVYFIDILFNAYVVTRTLQKSCEINVEKKEIRRLDEDALPIYTVLCPLYKEAHILPQFVKAMSKLDWPKEKLDIMLLLEEDDKESVLTIDTMKLPSFVRKVVVPHSLPKTKPKACNYGLGFTKGEFIVIYDAEDIPDPLQLKKAYIAFQKSLRSIVCIQAKLNYYNTNQNLLTRFFTAEYSLWFDVTLPGLQSLNTNIPLGGTSNHFRTSDLKLLNAWDPFNVTEDADLGIRLFKQGYQTGILNSVTLEEANSQVKNWLRQRSRWIKGYMQTYLVHTREIIPFIRERGIHALIFHLVIGGRIAFIFINPLLWILTIFYFTFQSTAGPFIEAIYTPPVLYLAISSLIFGNSLYLFCYMLGAVKNEQWSLIKYIFLIPLYWLLISIAGWIAFYQLIFKPHYWEKTVHGLHLQQKKKNLSILPVPAKPVQKNIKNPSPTI